MNSDLLHEQAYLKQTISLIQRGLAELIRVMDDEQEKLREAKLELQENQPAFADDRDKQAETAQYLSGLQTQLAAYRVYADRLKKLNMLSDSPYFGRVDFAEDCQKAESFYIGRASLRDPLTYQIQVCDWRSPLASIFYRSVPGKTSFMAPDGEISGSLLLKRQYEITKGELNYFFDTDFHIKDGVLKKLLSQKASARMKAIVESLQEAQDRLIRQKSKVLLIQGAAGSGKTSLAMHRAAYLMYQDFQDSLSSSEIIIISPNHIFSRYISRVLPELGEENITSLTFDDISSVTGPASGTTSRDSRGYDTLLSEKKRRNFLLLQDIRAFKHSAPFAALLTRLADYYERRVLRLPDVYLYNEYIATGQELKEDVLRDRRILPLAKRLEQTRRRLSEKIHARKKKRLPAIQEFVSDYPDHQLEILPFSRLLSMKRGAYLNKLLDNLPVIDIPGLYRRLWAKDLFYYLARGLDLPDNIEEIRRVCEKIANAGTRVGASAGTDAVADKARDGVTRGETARGAQSAVATVSPEDALGLIWLRLILEGTVEHQQIRQVIVDEAQDYGPLHFILLRKWFPKASFTVLGDIQQCMLQSRDLSHYQAIARALGEPDSGTAVLRASFRSTWEISSFCRGFLNAPDLMEPFERHGQPVEILGADTDREAVNLLLDTIDRFRADGIGTIAVICKTAAQVASLYSMTKGRSTLRPVSDSGATDLNRNLILPLYLAKGLEFDGVILWDVSRENYSWPEQKRFIYLAASRALHRLSLVYTGELSPLVADRA